MKRTTSLLMMTLALGLGASSALAQQSDNDRPPQREGRPRGDRAPGDRPPPGDRPGGPGPGARGFRPPIVAALDVNSDGVLDEKEIANASQALRKLDKNKDGKITPEEMRPEGRPPRREAAPRGNRPAPGDDNRPRRPRPDAE